MEKYMHKLLELLYSSGIVFRDAWHHKGAGRTGVSTKMKAGMQNGAGSASPTFFVTTFPSQPLLGQHIDAYLTALLLSSKRSLGYLLSLHHQKSGLHVVSARFIVRASL